MSIKTFETGPIRPPFHAASLLLRITENCTWNKCNFCTLYRGGSFKTRPVEVIKAEIDNVAYYRNIALKHCYPTGEFDIDAIMAEYNNLLHPQEKDCFSMVFNWIRSDNMENVFLQDANTLVLKPEVLADIVRHIKTTLPSVKLIAAYGRADTLVNISLEEFKMLKNAGLNMLHSGYESGCDEVLKLLNKGCTTAQQIEAGKRVKEAGIEFNIFYMPGSGGKFLSHKNAIDTAEVINQVNPDYVRLRTFVVKEGSPMWQLSKDGLFDECSDIGKLLELKTMLEHLKTATGYIVSDHIINLLPKIEGYMDKDIGKILNHINTFLELPKDKQRQFQIARRVHFLSDFNSFHRLAPSELNKIVALEKNLSSESEFEELLRRYLRNYI